MKVIWNKNADKTLQQTADYIMSEFGEKSMAKFLREVYHIADLLQFNPNMGRIEPLLDGFSKTYRSFVVTQYNKMVYYIDGNRIIITAFWDMRREPGKLTGEIEKNN